jgi:hypothetical protein
MGAVGDHPDAGGGGGREVHGAVNHQEVRGDVVHQPDAQGVGGTTP